MATTNEPHHRSMAQATGNAKPRRADWLLLEEHRLLKFPYSFVTPDGRAPLLDDRGAAMPATAPTFQTARFAFVCALAALRGDNAAAADASTLNEFLLRTEKDGWGDTYPSDDGAAQSLYTLSFIILASATGLMAEVQGSETLLRRALSILSSRFWDESLRRGLDKVHPSGEIAAYRGINANMHLVEALAAAADATGDRQWATMALDVCHFVVIEAATRDWRINEHYDAQWRPLPEFNRDRPDHMFRPYGSTIGHGFEWSRLLAQASTQPGAEDLLISAEALYWRAREDGWAVDGNPGFVYTVDWAGRPVSRDRLHWIAAEALAASAVLAKLTEKASYTEDFERWTAHIREFFVDAEHGSWHHRLSADTLLPADHEDGKPDMYHAYQAVVLAQVPVGTSAAAAVTAAQGLTGRDRST
jgi:mannose/cellobiose epimerase-like protein (N-acyl-D-glucosamine 2-epimerase family)